LFLQRKKHISSPHEDGEISVDINNENFQLTEMFRTAARGVSLQFDVSPPVGEVKYIIHNKKKSGTLNVTILKQSSVIK
jgi:hypothetical protein